MSLRPSSSRLKKQDSVMFGRASGEGLWGGGTGNYFHFQVFFFTK